MLVPAWNPETRTWDNHVVSIDLRTEIERPSEEWAPRIKRLRIEAGLSQQDLAENFGWNRSAIAKMEMELPKSSLYHYVLILEFIKTCALFSRTWAATPWGEPPLAHLKRGDP